MKEIPLIFTGASIRAIQAGQKTQTRRVLRTQPPKNAFFSSAPDLVRFWVPHPTTVELRGYKYDAEFKTPCQPGDRLWARETWCTVNTLDDLAPSEIEQGETGWPRVWYKATDTHPPRYRYHYFGRWRSPRFMPRWASRILLPVEDLRVERLQDISHKDALAEGVDPEAPYNDYGTGSIHVDAFAELWDSLNAKRGWPWAKNPWVWVYQWPKYVFDLANLVWSDPTVSKVHFVIIGNSLLVPQGDGELNEVPWDSLPLVEDDDVL
jgi:hypothetical protein